MVKIKETDLYFETVPFTYTLIVSAFSFKEILATKIHTIKQHIPLNINGNLFPISNINPAVNDPVTWPIALDEFKDLLFIKKNRK